MEAIQTITGPRADFTLECSGNPKAFRQAIDAVALRGVCGIVGAPAFGTEVPVDVWGILLGRTVRGSKVTNQPVPIEMDQRKRNYLHPVAGTDAARVGAGLFMKGLA